MNKIAHYSIRILGVIVGIAFVVVAVLINSHGEGEAAGFGVSRTAGAILMGVYFIVYGITGQVGILKWARSVGESTANSERSRDT